MSITIWLVCAMKYVISQLEHFTIENRHVFFFNLYDRIGRKSILFLFALLQWLSFSLSLSLCLVESVNVKKTTNAYALFAIWFVGKKKNSSSRVIHIVYYDFYSIALMIVKEQQKYLFSNDSKCIRNRTALWWVCFFSLLF